VTRVEQRRWSWHFDAPPDDVWAVMADTARFNEAAGFPRHEIEEVAQPDGSVIYIASTRVGPMRVSWREIPVQWVSGERFEHCREFLNGPFTRLCATMELTPESGGTRATYLVEVALRGLWGRLIAPAFMRGAGRTFGRLSGEAMRYLAGNRETPFEIRPPKPNAAVKARLQRLVASIDANANGHGLANRLAEFVVGGSELDLQFLRPLRLARSWGVPARHVVELCLEATRQGLLDRRWVLLCPRCRGAKVQAETLDRLPQGAHCPTCNIDYGRDFERNVELTFRPAPALRPVDDSELCLFAPMTTPHVKIQQTLAPGESRALAVTLAPGDYRLRTLHPGGQADLGWSDGGFAEVVADGRAVQAGAPAPPGEVRLVNASDREQTVVIESRAWIADALTAHKTMTLQTFRDLFPGEVLRAGDDVSIGQITLMFTDLRGSTALYERVGDVAAYGLVQAHFAYLADKVRAHDGAIVKTIGDAVMAAFSDPADAVRAALEIQRNVAGLNAAQSEGGGNDIVIRLGLHAGPAVAVTLNERLDYFGTTVNLAARLEAESTGGDIVLSRRLADDPAVAKILESFDRSDETAMVRGFEAPVRYVRLWPDAVRSGGTPVTSPEEGRP